MLTLKQIITSHRSGSRPSQGEAKRSARFDYERSFAAEQKRRLAEDQSREHVLREARRTEQAPQRPTFSAAVARACHGGLGCPARRLKGHRSVLVDFVEGHPAAGYRCKVVRIDFGWVHP